VLGDVGEQLEDPGPRLGPVVAVELGGAEQPQLGAVGHADDGTGLGSLQRVVGRVTDSDVAPGGGAGDEGADPGEHVGARGVGADRLTEQPHGAVGDGEGPAAGQPRGHGHDPGPSLGELDQGGAEHLGQRRGAQHHRRRPHAAHLDETGPGEADAQPCRLPGGLGGAHLTRARGGVVTGDDDVEAGRAAGRVPSQGSDEQPSSIRDRRALDRCAGKPAEGGASAPPPTAH